MKRTKAMFAISLIILITSLVIVLFYDKYLNYFNNFIVPISLIFIALDALIVLIPIINKTTSSNKHLKKYYNVKIDYNKKVLHNQIKQQNRRALLIFIIYFGVLSIIGLAYLKFPIFKIEHLYIIFFAINFFDYFCILIWCPFRSLILKNRCCNTCRITNWDRFMKFYILIFIPNPLNLALVIIGIIIIVIWEYMHYRHPERFYSVSNKSLSCIVCDKQLKCKK